MYRMAMVVEVVVTGVEVVEMRAVVVNGGWG